MQPSGRGFQELRGIVEEAEDFEGLRGGSSITQQTVKNLFLWHGRSYVRKALELPLALWADLVLPKRRVLEIYLNIAEWGPSGQFGPEAAARQAFGKPARNLTAGEAAVLAAVCPTRRGATPVSQLRPSGGSQGSMRRAPPPHPGSATASGSGAPPSFRGDLPL